MKYCRNCRARQFGSYRAYCWKCWYPVAGRNPFEESFRLFNNALQDGLAAGIGGVNPSVFGIARAEKGNTMPSPKEDKKYQYPQSLKKWRPSLFFWSLKRVIVLQLFIYFTLAMAMLIAKWFLIWFGEYIV